MKSQTEKGISKIKGIKLMTFAGGTTTQWYHKISHHVKLNTHANYRNIISN